MEERRKQNNEEKKFQEIHILSQNSGFVVVVFFSNKEYKSRADILAKAVDCRIVFSY